VHLLVKEKDFDNIKMRGTTVKKKVQQMFAISEETIITRNL